MKNKRLATYKDNFINEAEATKQDIAEKIQELEDKENLTENQEEKLSTLQQDLDDLENAINSLEELNLEE